MNWVGSARSAKAEEPHVWILVIYPGMAASEYVLGLIPGELISAAAKTLPDPEKNTEAFREVEIGVPGRFKAKVRSRSPSLDVCRSRRRSSSATGGARLRSKTRWLRCT